MKLLIALAAGALLAHAQPVAVTHVTVIDVEAGRSRPDMTVVVAGGRISAVRQAARVTVPRGSQIVDGRGKFLIPGLWDMHVHMFSALPPGTQDPAARVFFAPNFVARGISGVRSMFDDLGAIRELRAAVAAGTLAGPEVVASGPILDGAPAYWPGSIACANPEQGRAAVRRLKDGGVDFIKVYSLLSRETYFAIADEAQKAGLPFAGHVPNGVTAVEASDAGQRSIEHLLGVFASCSSREAEFARDGAKFGDSMRAAAESYDPRKAAALFAKFAANGTWQTPTLVALRTVAYAGDAEFEKDERIRQVPASIRQIWRGLLADMAKPDAAARRRQFERELTLVGAMHKAGVKILAGTDTPNPYVFPGSGLHDELELLVKAGLTPMDALRSATIRPAEYLGAANGMGSIAADKAADMVLLEGDPLADIANTRRIAAVVLKGKVYAKSDLAQMLLGARKALGGGE